MTRGRPKGSTGNYFRWPPDKIADLFQDADLIADTKGKINKKHLAERLKQEFPDKYRYVSEKQLQQLLSKKYQSKKRLGTRDEFNADVLAHLLGEK
jgi:hypothetical protein